MHLLSSQASPEIPETMTTNEKNNRLLRYARNHGRGDKLKESLGNDLLSSQDAPKIPEALTTVEKLM